jgi:hypothetical protein
VSTDGNVAKRMTTQAAIFNLGVWEQTTATVQQPKEKIMASRTYKEYRTPVYSFFGNRIGTKVRREY